MEGATSLSQVVDSLYGEAPSSVLYHYTSIDAALKILPDRKLWASDVHYLNDASELQHARETLAREARTLLGGGEFDAGLLSQFSDWLEIRVMDGHMLFVVCFSEDGDLLSQWRGYTPHGKGVSLGFSPSVLRSSAAAQSFRFGRCVYDLQAQRSVAAATVRAVATAATAVGPSQDAHPHQSYHGVFASMEADILAIAALLKNDAFSAEREWRAVSLPIEGYVEGEMSFRPARTTLVPYVNFCFDDTAGSPLSRVVVGPTPNFTLAIGALSKFLTRVDANPRLGTAASRVPYRET